MIEKCIAKRWASIYSCPPGVPELSRPTLVYSLNIRQKTEEVCVLSYGQQRGCVE